MDQARYREKYLEKKFLESESFMRLFLYTGPSFYIIFSIADHIKYPEFASEFLFIRIAISLLMLSSYYVIRKNISFIKNQIASMIWTFLTTTGIAYMIYRSGDPLSSYYIGITLVSVFSLTFGVYEKKLYLLTLILSNLPYIIITILNYEIYLAEWRIFAIYWIFNLGFIAAITTAHIRRNRDYANIINAELNLENEILNRQKIIDKNRLEISNLKSKELELLQKSFQFELAQKLSHDIRSPISTLNIISSKLENSELKELQIHALKQINNIAHDLLNYSKEVSDNAGINSISNKMDFVTLLSIIESEYKLKSDFINRELNFEISNLKNQSFEILNSFAYNLYSVINNLIQNAIEATNPNTGKIDIFIELYDKNKIKMLINDNGVGIPSDILNRLGKEKISYRKTQASTLSGNGIAIFNAVSMLKNNGGELRIKSKENIGTSVEIIFHQT